MTTAKKSKKQFNGRGSDGGGYVVSPLFGKYYDEELSYLKDLLYNSIKINGLGYYEEFFVKSQLFSVGYVGLHEGDGFYITIPEKVIPQFGRLWKNGIFKDEYNKSIGVHEYNYETAFGDTWRILLASPTFKPLFNTLETYAALLADCRVAIKQNLNAVKTPSFWVVDDADFALSVKQATQQTLEGEAAVIVKKTLAGALSSMKNETPFVADKVHEEYRELLNEVLSRVGILTANTSKRERVQSAEVNAGVGQAIDNIYTIIDFWNKQIETYNLPYKMEFNGTIEELYTDEESEQETINEVDL